MRIFRVQISLDHFLDLSWVISESYPPRFVNSQLACLLSVLVFKCTVYTVYTVCVKLGQSPWINWSIPFNIHTSPVDEVVFHFEPLENSFLRDLQKCIWMKCFIGVALKKFSNIQKPLRKIAVDDTNVMFFPYNFLQMKQIFQNTSRKKAEILDISPPTLQKTNRTKYPLRNLWSNHTP